MKKSSVIRYKNNYCIIILKNKFKYEGFIKTIFEDSFILNDKKIGDIEIDIDSLSLIIPSKEITENEFN